MATFIVGKPNTKRRRAALQAALYHARKDNIDRRSSHAPAVLDLISGRDFTNAAWKAEGAAPTISVEPATLRHDGSGNAQLVTVKGQTPFFGLGGTTSSLYQLVKGYPANSIVDPTFWVKRQHGSTGTLYVTGFNAGLASETWGISLANLPDDNWHQISFGSPLITNGNGNQHMVAVTLPIPVFGYQTGDIIAGVSISGVGTTSSDPLSVYLDAFTCRKA